MEFKPMSDKNAVLGVSDLRAITVQSKTANETRYSKKEAYVLNWQHKTYVQIVPRFYAIKKQFVRSFILNILMFNL